MAEGAWAAVVVAGGRGSRLGGVDKPGLVVGGRTLLDRVLGVLGGADERVVVGPERGTAVPVRWTIEADRGAGPVAAVAAGVELVTAPTTVLLAADLPALTEAALGRLRARAHPDGAVLVDAEGREQWLTSAWPTDRLKRALASGGRGLYAVLGPMRPALLPDTDGAASDVDTPEDLARWRGRG